MPDPRRERHERYVAYVERYRYFGRGKPKLQAEEFHRLEERLAARDVDPAEAGRLRVLLLLD